MAHDRHKNVPRGTRKGVIMKDTTITRVNLKLPSYVRDFYRDQGERYGVPYGNFITMTLIQVYEQTQQKQMLEELSVNMSALKDMADGVDVNQALSESKGMILDMQELAKALPKS